MTDQPVGDKQQSSASTGKASHDPPPPILKTETDSEKAGDAADKTEKTGRKIQISPPTPVEPRRMWTWIKSWSVWTWIKSKAEDVTLADWAMVFFTFVLAATTIVFTVYAKRQWEEMHSGGEDTKKLAEQAKAQTDKMADSLSKTDALIRQATEQALATNNLASVVRQAD